jgi:penicillin-binding protein 1C
MIYPGRNQSTLLDKRNRLLDLLLARSVIDRVTWELARSERLPGKPFPLPQKAPHLLDRLVREGHQGQKLTTTLDGTTQDRVSEILLNHRPRLIANEIYNAAVLIVEVASGNVLCYCGNLPHASGPETKNRMETGNSVDIITSPRSTGSILKPFLYAAQHPGTRYPHADRRLYPREL